MTEHGAATRQRILDVTGDLIETKGLAQVTMRGIAHAIGLTEAALYKHFRSKAELITEVVGVRLHPLLTVLGTLPDQAGRGSPQANLEAFVRALVRTYAHTLPIGMSLFADPGLLQQIRAALVAEGVGPHRHNEILAIYLREEKALGRIRPGVSADALADMIVGACFQRALVAELMGPVLLRSDRAFIDDLVETVGATTG